MLTLRLRRELPALLSWLGAGMLQLDPFVTTTRSLDELEQAFEDLRAGKGLRSVPHRRRVTECFSGGSPA